MTDRSVAAGSIVNSMSFTEPLALLALIKPVVLATKLSRDTSFTAFE
jgi:hypothetical protein